MEIVKSEIKEYFRDVVLEETNPRLDIFFEEINDSLYFTLEGILRCEYNMKILTYTTIIKKFEFEGNLKNVVIDKVHELGIMEEFINQAFTFTKSQDLDLKGRIKFYNKIPNHILLDSELNKELNKY